METTNEATYALPVWRDETGGRMACATCTMEGEEKPVLAVFESTAHADAGDAAEAHMKLRNLGAGWRVVEGTAEDLLELLGVIGEHFEYVALNPPISVKGETPPEINPLPIERFAG